MSKWLIQCLDQALASNYQINWVPNPLGKTFPDCVLLRDNKGQFYFGKGETLAQRTISALCESFERKLLWQKSPELYHQNEARKKWGESCQAANSTQYFSADEKLPWCVYYNYLNKNKMLFVRPKKGRQCENTATSSNGAAISTSKSRAITKSMFELAERDAFCHFWYTQDGYLFDLPLYYTNSLKNQIDACGWLIKFYILPNEYNLPIVLCAAKANSTSSIFSKYSTIISCSGQACIFTAAKDAFYEVLQSLEMLLINNSSSIQNEHIAYYLSHQSSWLQYKLKKTKNINTSILKKYSHPNINNLLYDSYFSIKKHKLFNQYFYYSEAKSDKMNDLPIKGVNYNHEGDAAMLSLLRRSRAQYSNNSEINPLA